MSPILVPPLHELLRSISMVILFSILISGLVLTYSATLFWLRWGLSRLRPGSRNHHPFVSIVIAARNEEQGIESCLAALTNQTYPHDRHEIIVVNDRSSDSTGNLIQNKVDEDDRFRRIDIEEERPGMAPKKWALHRGIQEAKGEIVMTTDADCIVGPEWIDSIIRHFEDDVGLVAGFSPLERSSSNSLFRRLITLDALSLAAVAAGSFGGHCPFTCSGRNLAYRTSVYESIGGFESIGHFISGDDDLLLHLVRDKTSWKMRYAVETTAIVPSAPPDSIGHFIQQRLRHASKGRHYKISFTLGLVAVYGFNICMILCLFFVRLWPILGIVFAIKSFSEYILIRRAARILSRRTDLRVFPLAALLHPLYVVVLGGIAQWARFRWKGVSYNSRGTEPERPIE